MKGTFVVFLTAVLLLVFPTHRLPAPIVEEEKPTPAPQQSARPKPKRTAESKAESESPKTTTTLKATESVRTRARRPNVESVSREAKEKRSDNRIPNDGRGLPGHSATVGKRFAGTWSGILHEENGRSYPVTVVVDPTETKAIANGPVFANEEGRVQINGDTLTWNWMLDSWIMTLRSETTAQLVKRYFNSTHTGTIERTR
jgi:hypothetical protein